MFLSIGGGKWKSWGRKENDSEEALFKNEKRRGVDFCLISGKLILVTYLVSF
jgi:hypothetical protein